ncbi:NAD(P)-dependent oxidoreductase [Amycolatopsis sp. FDAARGOS 1241]|uniref:NAD(P)-dependent oxidoreductase n=1 Tax=Amycolatopsis sp. FDAARGOS 1241 TaxID=2778070 RepID=UPI00194F4FBE|nr:NAD(P)H-binding protein [Amycolatopsis sp. FDAARGOS 1241]QRP47012.1 NAD(P)H-binding protein [Amycolatopsis sp. FDAARGOS 1241]
MGKLVVFGATGYAGGRITEEALRRGHTVTGVARKADGLPAEVEVRAGSMHDAGFVADVTRGADVIVVATPGRANEEGKSLLDALPTLVDAARAAGARLSFVGGAGSLRVAEGGPRLIDTPEFPEEYKPEAGSHAEVLAALERLPADVDWFYVSPAAEFGAWNAGERTGKFRVGGDVLLAGEDGRSHISGADLAIAYLDEIDEPRHSRRRFTVAY